MPFPFEVGFDEVQSNLDVYVDAVFGCLKSESEQSQTMMKNFLCELFPLFGIVYNLGKIKYLFESKSQGLQTLSHLCRTNSHNQIIF